MPLLAQKILLEYSRSKKRHWICWSDAEKRHQRILFRDIKDEVFAFIKENEPVKNIIQFIREDYAHELFSSFPEHTRKEAIEFTLDIIQKLSSIPLWNQGRRGRALLIHLLYPIPFQDLDRWIPVIKRYYEKHPKNLDS